MDRRALVQELLAALRAELATAERAARETAAAANHPEARPENDKDTRKVELSYLAAGQASRARELEEGLHRVGALAVVEVRAGAPAALGALVTIEVDGKIQRLFLCPAGGGMTLCRGGEEVRVVTPEAPLGRALLGRIVGEAVEAT
ncbi:MAG: transcription elongation factor GreAB, partial [Deltaproteobacteria bacterium]|nr:transcription elongation factor GreAB [Deltaproteobacteria bacterium]